VQGNYIGVDESGNDPLENGGSGVVIISLAHNNTIGGATVQERNAISGNDANGILLDEGVYANLIKGNLIGCSADRSTIIPNKSHGILILGSSHDNIIGDPEGVWGNHITHNTYDGIYIQSGFQISIVSNYIYANGSLGIDIEPDGINPNDACDEDIGANNMQNYPELHQAIFENDVIYIVGEISGPPYTTFDLEFFLSDNCDPSGYGEGLYTIGSKQVTTDGNCMASFDAFFFTQGFPADTALTATATDPNGNTSEFSNCVVIPPTPTPTPSPTPIEMPPPYITDAIYNDEDNDGIVEPGETLTLVFDQGVTGTLSLYPYSFYLPVDGDDLGEVGFEAIHERYNTNHLVLKLGEKCQFDCSRIIRIRKQCSRGSFRYRPGTGSAP